jgi:hypothetical protein
MRLALQTIIDRGQVAYGELFVGSQGADAIGNSGNQDPAILVAHLRDQRCRHGCGIGNPIAVVSVVQGAHGAVDRCVQADDAARAEINHRPPRLMHRAVADQNEIGGESGAIVPQHVGEVRRTGFFLAFPQYFDIHRGRRTGGFEGIERGQKGHDGCLVVADGAAEKPPFGIERGARASPVDHLLPGVEGAAAHHRHEGVRGPLRRGYRLTVVVSIENYGPLGARGIQYAEHQGGSSGAGGELPRLEAALAQ